MAGYGSLGVQGVFLAPAITDFGVPKVLGGEYSMLATEIFKQVVGLQDFAMGATVSLVLLLPCVPAFVIDGWARPWNLRGDRGGRQPDHGPGAVLLLPRATQC